MRYEHWPETLVEKLKEWKDIPFVWGSTDCASFVIDVVNAISDHGVKNRVSGEYDNERDALRCISSLGENLAELVTLRFGQPIPVLMAQRGDVLMHNKNLGICIGSVGVFRGENGSINIPFNLCELAWRVD